MSRWLLSFLTFFVFAPASAHDGAWDSTGCHRESTNPLHNSIHCHEGSFAGQSFDSAIEHFKAMLELENPSFSGPAKVIDGDTLVVNEKRVRLWGIDAPELDQTCQWPNKTIECGKLAKAAVEDLVAASGDVTCYPNDSPVEMDDAESVVAICVASNGFDIGQSMVHAGWAIDLREHSIRYNDAEDAAKEAKSGLWQGEFILPRDWRRRQR